MRSKAQVKSRRFGYPNTGYAFRFVSCPNEKSMASYASRLPGSYREKWMSSGKNVPCGFTASICRPVLPGVIPEADGSFLCEIILIVRAAEAPGIERMSWHHEIGHAVDFAIKLSTGRPVASDPEFPAFCTEFLMECLRAFEEGSDDASSGFLSLFPWLCEDEATVSSVSQEAYRNA